MFSFSRTKNNNTATGGGDLGPVNTSTNAKTTDPNSTDLSPPARSGERRTRAEDSTALYLRALGLPPTATWEEVTEAHRRLVSDLTPGPGASHQNVKLAEEFLKEVNHAYASLRVLAVA